jgi:FkbM family methyltransferase
MFEKFVYNVRPALLAEVLKLLFRIKRKYITHEHGEFFIDPASNFGRSLIDETCYEPELTNRLTDMIKPGDYFLDIGANEGWFSVIASKRVGHKGIVYSVEPQTRLKPILLENLKLNECTNVLISDAMISNRNGMNDIYITPSTNSGSSGAYNILNYSVQKQTCMSYTLERFLHFVGHEKINIAKVDIEGGEWELIASSQKLLSNGCINNLFLEVHPHILKKLGKSCKEIEVLLTRCGFEICKFGDSWLCKYKESRVNEKGGL